MPRIITSSVNPKPNTKIPPVFLNLYHTFPSKSPKILPPIGLNQF
jgi:hypothetical protein